MATDELRGMQERAAQVQEMVEGYGWPLLLDRASTTILAKQTRIVQGQCDTHEEYVKECAFLDGVGFMMRLPELIQMELERYLDQMTDEEGLEFPEDGGV